MKFNIFWFNFCLVHILIYFILYFILQGIEGKVVTVTVDNASYNDLAVRTLADSLQAHRSLPLGGKLLHVRCCAHILNLLVQDGIDEISDIIESVRDSVKYISASITRLKLFAELAKQCGCGSKRLILDCTTRWNATYMMLSVALEYRQVLPIQFNLTSDVYNFETSSSYG